VSLTYPQFDRLPVHNFSGHVVKQARRSGRVAGWLGGGAELREDLGKSLMLSHLRCQISSVRLDVATEGKEDLGRSVEPAALDDGRPALLGKLLHVHALDRLVVYNHDRFGLGGEPERRRKRKRRLDWRLPRQRRCARR